MCIIILQAQYASPAVWVEAVIQKTGNDRYFEQNMYVTLSSQLREYLDEHEVKEIYSLTGTEVNTITTKAATETRCIKCI
jgi:4-aminobutyrate aminotransferase-like enzyme